MDETLTGGPYVRLAFSLSFNEMSLAGPVLIVSDRPHRKLAAALAAAGASAGGESALTEAAGALSRIPPGAGPFSDSEPAPAPPPPLPAEMIVALDPPPAPFP